MSDDRSTRDMDVARSLIDLGERLRTSAPEPALEGIRSRVHYDAEAIRQVTPRRRVPARLIAAAVAAGLAIGIAAIPPLRSAVADLLDIEGIRIRYQPRDRTEPPPVGAGFQLGDRLDLARARDRVDFSILVPGAAGYRDPAEVYVRQTGGGIASFVYPPSPDAASPVILTQFEADPTGAFEKILDSGTRVEQLTINGEDALWLTGQEHLLFFVDPTDGFVDVPGHVAGNTLLWTRGDVTLRLEGDLTRQQALDIAESVHP